MCENPISPGAAFRAARTCEASFAGVVCGRSRLEHDGGKLLHPFRVTAYSAPRPEIQADARNAHVEPVKAADRADDGTHGDSGDPVERVRLTGWCGFDGKVKALLVGELIKRALPVTEQYLSDLYHDVHWVDEYVTGPCTFYFSARTYGTVIGTVPHFGVDGGSERFHNYVVELEGVNKLGFKNDIEWFATFTRVDSDEEAIATYKVDNGLAVIASERVAADRAAAAR